MYVKNKQYKNKSSVAINTNSTLFLELHFYKKKKINKFESIY